VASRLACGEIYEGILFGSERRSHEIGFRNFLRVADVLSLNRGVMLRFAQLRGSVRQQCSSSVIVTPAYPIR
jgi:hypothetical protein